MEDKKPGPYLIQTDPAKPAAPSEGKVKTSKDKPERVHAYVTNKGSERDHAITYLLVVEERGSADVKVRFITAPLSKYIGKTTHLTPLELRFVTEPAGPGWETMPEIKARADYAEIVAEQSKNTRVFGYSPHLVHMVLEDRARGKP